MVCATLASLFLLANYGSIAFERFREGVKQRNAIEQLHIQHIRVEEDRSTSVRSIDISISHDLDAKTVALFKSIPALRSLELEDGNVSDAAMEALPAAAPHLQYLSIKNVTLSDSAFARIGDLHDLKHLLMTGRALSESRLTLLANLPDLDTLIIASTDVLTVSRYDTFHISRFPCLKRLALRRAAITKHAFEGLSTLRLEMLSLQACSWECAEKLERLQSLKEAYLDDGSAGDEHLKYLGQLPHLQTLSLKQTTVSDKNLGDLAGLGELGILDLRGTQITDAAVPHLSRLTSLRLLRAEDTKLSERGRTALSNGLPNAHVEIGSTPR